MKKLVFFIICLLLNASLFANNTTVVIKFRGLKSSTIDVVLPINEIWFPFNKKTYNLSPDSTITISTQVNKIVLLRLYGLDINF